MADIFDFLEKLPLGFGGAAISGEGRGYGFGKISEEESVDLLQAAFERGIRLFDTAPIYGFGESERRIGKAFKNNREAVFIVSKSGVSWHKDTHRVNMTNDPAETLLMLESSLRSLNSDYIDLYMIHWPDERVDIRRPMEVLAKAKDQGKIKHIGLCNTYVEDILKAQELGEIAAVQGQLNIFEVDAIEELFPFLKEKGIPFMSWGTLDKGILTGRVTKNRKYEREDCRSWAPWWKESNYLKKVEVMDKLLPLLAEDGVSGLELALGFNLSFDSVKCALVGTRNLKQLDNLIASFARKVPEDRLNRYVEQTKI